MGIKKHCIYINMNKIIYYLFKTAAITTELILSYLINSNNLKQLPKVYHRFVSLSRNYSDLDYGFLNLRMRSFKSTSPLETPNLSDISLAENPFSTRSSKLPLSFLTLFFSEKGWADVTSS